MARSVPHDYDLAAQAFYAAGRAAFAAGEPRESNTSATNPNNAAAWDQSFRSDVALTGSPLARQYGPVEMHWWAGYDDARSAWFDRGWRYSIAKGYASPPINSDGTMATRGRLYHLRYVYTFIWKDPSNAGWGRGKSNPDPDGLNYLTQDEIDWEIDRARQDRLGGTTQPQEGYVDPSTAGLPQKGAVSVPTTAATPYQYPYAGYNWAAVQQAQRQGRGPYFGSGGGLWNVLPLLLGR